MIAPLLRNFAHDMHGAGGILAGIREAAATPGSLARFVVQVHPVYADKYPPEAHVLKVVEVGLELDGPDGRPSWRYASGGDLKGGGSHALVASWYDDQSVEHATANLAHQLGRQCPDGYVIFRVMP